MTEKEIAGLRITETDCIRNQNTIMQLYESLLNSQDNNIFIV
jgi:hypothetical protein